MKIANLEIGSHVPPVIIAEAGINHGGDLKKALQLVEGAAHAGAHIVKFQTHFTDCEMLRDGPSAGYVGGSFYDLIKSCELRLEDYARLKNEAEAAGLVFMSTAFCWEAVDFLDDLGVPAFKVGSGELTNIPLQVHIAKKRKPMIISTGMSTLNEIKATLNAIWDHQFKPVPWDARVTGDPRQPYNETEFLLLNCASTYPAHPAEARLLGIKQLKDEFDCYVGQSDHTPGIAVALGAVARGALVIEKHFTVTKQWAGPDMPVSITVAELKRLVEESRQVWEALTPRQDVLEGEIPVQAMARHSVVTTRAIKWGEILSEVNLGTKRPGTGIPAGELPTINGKTATCDLPVDHLLLRSDYE